MSVDPRKVEILKTWYSVFCTLVDAYDANEYSDYGFIRSMKILRNELADAAPEVEEEMKRSKQ